MWGFESWVLLNLRSSQWELTCDISSWSLCWGVSPSINPRPKYRLPRVNQFQCGKGRCLSTVRAVTFWTNDHYRTHWVQIVLWGRMPITQLRQVWIPNFCVLTIILLSEALQYAIRLGSCKVKGTWGIYQYIMLSSIIWIKHRTVVHTMLIPIIIIILILRRTYQSSLLDQGALFDFKKKNCCINSYRVDRCNSNSLAFVEG